MPQWGVAAVDLLRSVWIAQRLGHATWRSMQPRTAGRGSSVGRAHGPRRQVRQVTLAALACFDLQGPRRLHSPTQAVLGGAAAFTVLVCFYPRDSAGSRRDPPNLL